MRPHATVPSRKPANVPNRDNVRVRVGYEGSQSGESRATMLGFWLTVADAEALLEELRVAVGKAKLAEMQEQAAKGAQG